MNYLPTASISSLLAITHGSLDIILQQSIPPPLSLHKLMVCPHRILWWTREWIWRKCIVFFGVFCYEKYRFHKRNLLIFFSAITTFNTKSIILAIDSHLISEYYFNFEMFQSTLLKEHIALSFKNKIACTFEKCRRNVQEFLQCLQ